MPRTLGLAMFLAALTAGLPILAQEEGPDPKLVIKALSTPYLQGKLVKIDAEKKLFVVQAVIDTKKTLNKENQARYNQLYGQLAQAYRGRDKAGYDRLLPQVQAAYVAVYDIQETTHNFEFVGAEGLKFRRLSLPAREGEDGKPKPYTPQEQAKLKGPDANAPGFMADVKEFDVEMPVRVYFPPKSTASKTGEKAKPADPKEKAAGPALPTGPIPITYLLLLPNQTAVTTQPGTPPPPVNSINPFIVK